MGSPTPAQRHEDLPRQYSTTLVTCAVFCSAVHLKPSVAILTPAHPKYSGEMSEEVAQHMEFARVARTKRLRFEQDKRHCAGFGQEEVAVKKIRISSGNMNTSWRLGGLSAVCKRYPLPGLYYFLRRTDCPVIHWIVLGYTADASKSDHLWTGRSADDR